MANYDWTIEHSANNGSTWTEITQYVQGWSYSYGRRTVTDQWSTGTGFMQGITPASLPSIAVGDWIRFHETALDTVYVLQVGDYNRVYNIAGASADRWEISLEDAYSQVGRARVQSDSSSPAGTDTNTIVSLIPLVAGVDAYAFGGTKNLCSALTLNEGDSIVEQANKINFQAGAYVQANRVDIGIYWYAYDATDWYGDPYNDFHETTYSDDGGTHDYEYEQIQFEGLATSYFDAVNVTPAGLATQSARTGVRTNAIDTYDYTTAQAQSWASYLLQQLGGKTQTPTTIVTSAAAQKGALPDLLELLPGNVLEIQLRGLNYYSIIEGGTVSATPDNTRITLHLSDRDAVNFLLLNNSNWGRLDENRLGF